MKTTILDVDETVPECEGFIKDLAKEGASIGKVIKNHNGTVNLVMNHPRGFDIEDMVECWNNLSKQSKRV